MVLAISYLLCILFVIIFNFFLFWLNQIYIIYYFLLNKSVRNGLSVHVIGIFNPWTPQHVSKIFIFFLYFEIIKL